MNIKSLFKRYFPISNLWFFQEVDRQKRELKAERRHRDSFEGDLQKRLNGIDTKIGALSRTLAPISGAIERLSEREDYLISLLERKLDIPLIDAIELYFIEVRYKREFSFGAWPTRVHCCVSVRSGAHRGWGEIRLANAGIPNEKVVADTLKAFSPWKGRSLNESRHLVIARRGKTQDRILEALDMALVDLSARLEGKSALEYLGLPDNHFVPGLSCILQKDSEKACELARKLAKTHLKIKLFGDNVHDYNLIKAVRASIPENCFLVGDVNMGYGRDKAGVPFSNDIVRALSNLQDAGLDACEDPANLSWDDLAQLQSRLPELAIIPDEPMRPSYKVLESVNPVPGHIYNLHPNCMGSLVATVKLAQKLVAGGAKVMLGDDSLIGPACSAWQQVAIGVCAEWCESLEKSEESTAFTDCVVANPIKVDEKGFRSLAGHSLGFGLEVDCERLAKNSFAVVKV